jgi:hypothetical protein
MSSPVEAINTCDGLREFMAEWISLVRLPTPAHVAELTSGLNRLRRACPVAAWPDLTRSFRHHPAIALLHEEPCTHRIFHKPAGYAGDATMIDLIYRHRDALSFVGADSGRGRDIYWAPTAQPTTEANRFRRDLLTRKPNELSAVKEIKARGFLRKIEPTSLTITSDFYTSLALNQNKSHENAKPDHFTCIE